MSSYYSRRNTNAREHNFYGNGVRVPVEGPRGPAGPSGPPGPSGRHGVDGNHGLDGNADFIHLDAVFSSQNNVGSRLYNIDWNVIGSADLLADHRAFKNILTNQGNNNITVDVITLLFKPGVYKITWSGFPQNGTTYGTVFGFDKNHSNTIPIPNIFSGDDGNTLFWAPNNTTTYTIVQSISSNTCFDFVSRDTDTWRNVETIHSQLLIERIGHVEPLGTDQTLRTPNGGSELDPHFDSTIIADGIIWGQSYQAPPASYHPSTHTSQGGSNEWAVIELAADTFQTQFGWIRRIKRFI